MPRQQGELAHEHVPSSPSFFRLIRRAFLLGTVALLFFAWVIPAPLETPADFSQVPNPSKSAWFLLWLQEMLSYSSTLIYLVVMLAVFFIFLPWLPRTPPAAQARWFPAEQRLANTVTVVTFTTIVIMTAVAFFFRGENWSIVFPF